MWTKGNFSRFKWDQFLRLLNIMNLSMFSCSHFCPCRRGRCWKENPGEELVGAKSKPMSLVSRSVNRSPMLDSGLSHSPGNMECGSRNRSREMWTKTQHPVLKSGIKMKTLVQASRNRCRRQINAQASIDISIAKVRNRLKEPRMTHHNSEIFNTPYLEKSSRVYKKSWVVWKKARCWISRSMWLSQVKINFSDTEGSSSSRVALQ